MREDMFKVIVERPRKWKGGDSIAARQRRDLEGPPQLGMRAGYGYRALNENLNPLRRYLRAQVGRPWDKVYSEIARNIDRRNTVQQHIYQHLADFVAIKVARKEGQLVDLAAGLATWKVARSLWQELYVDPRTGLLRVNKDFRSWQETRAEIARARQAKVDARRRILDELTQLHLLDGEWYEVRLARVPASMSPDTAIFDAVMKRAMAHGKSTQEREERYGSYGLYAVSKRQLSRREKQRYDLA